MKEEKQGEKPAVFVFTTAYDPFIGGAEIAIQEVVERLNNEFRFFIFTSRFRIDLPKYEEKDGIAIRRIGFGFWFDKFFIPFLGFFVVKRFLRKEKPVLFWAVMATYASGIPYLINIFRPAKPTPVVLTLQEGDPVRHIKKAKFGLIGFSWGKALSRTSYLTAISTFLLNLGKEFGYKGEGAVIPNGVDVSEFTKEFPQDELRSLRKELGIAADEKVVITTSRLVHKNAVDVAIRAIGILSRSGYKVKFLVLGSGGEEEALKALVRKDGVGDSVIFLGDISHKDIPKYLKISDVFVRPSRSEGLGNSFIEAMAAGLPIVGTMAGGIPDFLEDGKTGLAVRIDDAEDCADKMETLFKNEELRGRIQGEGKKTAVARFQWDAIAEKYGEVFRYVTESAKKINLLIATGIFPPDIGGPATYSKLLVDELPSRGFRVEVLSFGTVRYLPKVIRHFVYFLKLIARARRANIIFAQDPVSVGLPAAIAAKLLKKKFILKVVGDYAWEQYQQKAQNSGARFVNVDEFQNEKFDFITELRRRIQKFVARRAGKIIVPSEYLKRIVCCWGVEEDKIVVIYNAVDAPPEKITKDGARQELGLSGSIAVSVGRLVPWKGFSALIESAAVIRKNLPDFKLYIIGSGPDEEKLKLEIKKFGLGCVVFIAGSVPHEVVLKYLAAADVFVLNTAYEGFSHTILEAMAAGIPVITTPVGGNLEIVRDGENGILVSYNDNAGIVDAVRRFLGDSAFRDQLSAQARATASRFTKEKMLAETVEVLDMRCLT
ncbi:MAG: glycosyltransferase family 4 protein [Candidatus Sungbacteria bacterium]|nr:glycosyltransferase family 4 protein [Candidatus Sungbacteria bacterium]